MRWNHETPYRVTWTTHERGPGYRHRCETFATETAARDAMAGAYSSLTIKVELQLFQGFDSQPRTICTRRIKRAA